MKTTKKCSIALRRYWFALQRTIDVLLLIPLAEDCSTSSIIKNSAFKRSTELGYFSHINNKSLDGSQNYSPYSITNRLTIVHPGIESHIGGESIVPTIPNRDLGVFHKGRYTSCNHSTETCDDADT